MKELLASILSRLGRLSSHRVFHAVGIVVSFSILAVSTAEAARAVGRHGAATQRGHAPTELVNFETADLSQTTGLECPSEADDFAVVTDPVRDGQYAARFHLDANSIAWGNGIPRCMFSLYDSDESVGDDYYYRFSIYLPSPVSDEGLWLLHAPQSLWTVSRNCSIAPIGLQARAHGFELRIMTGNCDRQWMHYEPHIRIPGLSRQPIGRWIDFVIHIRFAERPIGVVQLWYRLQGDPWSSKPAVSRVAIPTMPYSRASNIHNVRLYQMVGLYPGGSYSGNDTYFFDDFVRGSTGAAVGLPGARPPARSG